MANFEAFHWNFLLSANPEIGRSELRPGGRQKLFLDGGVPPPPSLPPNQPHNIFTMSPIIYFS